jgi:O-antigen/teichoic acid export membrane protein
MLVRPIGRNLLAGLTGSICTAVIGLAVVPLYIKSLGIESYGLIGFFTTTQALFQILDLGLAPTINREVARASASGEYRDVRNLLRTLACIYWILAGIIGLAVVLSAHVIATQWLSAATIPQTAVEHAVMLMGVVIACRWPFGIYQGVLMGAHRLTIASFINVIAAVMSNLGAVAVLEFVSPTIQAFFVWQACVYLVMVAAVRNAAWHALKSSGHRAVFDFYALKQVWRFSAGMICLAVAGIVFTQMDKIILSKVLPLEQFGYYTIATMAANGLLLLSAPTYNALYPGFSTAVVTGELQQLTRLYRVSTRLLAAALFAGGMILVVDSHDLLLLWTRSPAVAAAAAPIVALLAIGTAIHGVMYIPHALQLAYGLTRLPLTINGIMLVVMVPLIYFLAGQYGAIGAAAAWVILHVLYMLTGTALTHTGLLKGLALKWLLLDVGIPATVTTAIGSIALLVRRNSGFSPIANLACVLSLAVSAVLITIIASPQLRVIALQKVRMAMRA